MSRRHAIIGLVCWLLVPAIVLWLGYQLTLAVFVLTLR